MKTFIQYILLITCAPFICAQSYITKNLELNDVNLLANSDGSLFLNRSINAPGYEVPKGTGNNVIFASNFWFGGINQTNDTLVSSFKYRNNLVFFNGPVSTTNAYNSIDYIEEYDQSIWKVSKAEIEYHIDNFDQQGYEAPHGIKNWPGNGITQVGVSQYLAPYVDVNNDGQYNADDGDYPCIRGDEAVYMIVNDAKGATLPTTSPPDGLGLEIHIMLYQFSANDYIDQTTFINLRIINRGQNVFSAFKPSFYVDADIGFAFDDYIGCDTNNNVGYAYNATNFDPGGSGASGYGNNPPAVGVVCLNHKMDYFGYYLNGGPSLPYTDPVTPVQYWNYMNGYWKDGTPWVKGGTGYTGTIGASSTPAKYLYPGNPLTQSGWSEVNTDGNGYSNPNDEDKRFIITSESQSFVPNQIVEYDYAIIFDNSGNHLENANNIIGLAEQVEGYFQNTIFHQSCIQQGTGISDNFTPQPDSILTNQMFEITRLDGEGNMGLSVKLKPETEANILDSNQVERVHYERGKGPIMAYIFDTLDHVSGYFQLKFNNFASDIDSAYWTVYRYDTFGGTLLDSVESLSTITDGDIHYIYDWGIAIQVKQSFYSCNFNVAECPQSNKQAYAISSSLTFENNSNKWLTGVKDNGSMTPTNWIQKLGAGYDDSIINEFSPACYVNGTTFNSESGFDNIVGGIIAPSRYTRINECGFQPLQNPNPHLTGVNFPFFNAVSNHMPTVFHPSIDIVFTPDQTKWTRCPVIELNNDPFTSVGAAIPGMLRQSPSVDKNGNPDNSGTYGMSWFPGYVIDVETGRRLNMAFCENSTLTDDNGADMIWNPTDRIYDNFGNPVLGGQHAIYVFGGENDGMPTYDEGEFLYNSLSSVSTSGLNAVYKNLSWVMQPLLSNGENLLDNEARISVRINKEFKNYEISNYNNGNPMFEWNVVPYESLNQNNFIVTNNIHVFPNPTNSNLTVAWDEKNVSTLQVLNTHGQIMQQINLSGTTQQLTLDVSSFTGGIYFVKVGGSTAKVLIY